MRVAKLASTRWSFLNYKNFFNLWKLIALPFNSVEIGSDVFHKAIVGFYASRRQPSDGGVGGCVGPWNLVFARGETGAERDSFRLFRKNGCVFSEINS
ncbi:MAG TPA: hypothetical protein PK648_06390 [Verrucomicrobiales bacterium]|nr:hypothetical protein [Verrucomicrobiales bacterium]